MSIFKIIDKKQLNIADSFLICSSIAKKARGLMFTRKSFVDDNSLIFTFDDESIRSLHMLFVFYPIDIIFLNKDKKVVDKKENFRPFTLFCPSVPSQFIIELPVDTIEKKGIDYGDIIEWESK